MEEQRPSLFKRLTGSLFWRLAVIFFLVLVATTAWLLYITMNTAEMYAQESSQQLNRSVASHISKFTTPFTDGVLNEEDLENTFFDIMVMNPSVECYLLDTTGNILSYNAPENKVKLERVPLGPIHDFIRDTTEQYITNEDPRNPGTQKVFAAAKVKEDGVFRGYFYTVLASEEHTSVMEMLNESYFMKLAGRSVMIVLIVALVVGFLMLFLLTRNLKKIVGVVKRFQGGDHKARIDLKSRGELTQLASDYNAMADTIVNYIEEIKSVESLRRELIANVSHDLRTPLATIQGYAETLTMKADSLDDAEKAKYTETILKGTERIKKLVDDLFELSKLETKQVKAQFEFFSLAELVSDISSKYELLAQKQNVIIKPNIPQDLPMIYADIALIDRVLQNLVDNALKHTPESGTISIELVPFENHLEVLVADTGLGITPEELPYIFDRYAKARSNRKEGTGLGLAIVKKILELHDSTISVTSKVDVGTTFRFQLPTAELTLQ